MIPVFLQQKNIPIIKINYEYIFLSIDFLKILNLIFFFIKVYFLVETSILLDIFY